MKLLCYKDSYIKRPNIVVQTMLYVVIVCLIRSRPIHGIQMERIYENDLKTVKYINYYVKVNQPFIQSLINVGFYPVTLPNESELF